MIKQSKTKQNKVKELKTIKKTLKVVKFVDGDGLIAVDIFTSKEIEIRFYGVDAPEIKKCKKLLADEKALGIPSQLLIELGYKSLYFLKSLMEIDEEFTLLQEIENPVDAYGRQLGYVIKKDGSVINEILVSEGYVKPYNEVFCEMLPLYQKLSLKAKSKKKGLFSIVKKF